MIMQRKLNPNLGVVQTPRFLNQDYALQILLASAGYVNDPSNNSYVDICFRSNPNRDTTYFVKRILRNVGMGTNFRYPLVKDPPIEGDGQTIMDSRILTFFRDLKLNRNIGTLGFFRGRKLPTREEGYREFEAIHLKTFIPNRDGKRISFRLALRSTQGMSLDETMTQDKDFSIGFKYHEKTRGSKVWRSGSGIFPSFNPGNFLDSRIMDPIEDLGTND